MKSDRGMKSDRSIGGRRNRYWRRVSDRDLARNLLGKLARIEARIERAEIIQIECLKVLDEIASVCAEDAGADDGDGQGDEAETE